MIEAPEWLYASREEFAQETGIPGPLLEKALSHEQVGDLTHVQEAKIRAALAVISSELRSAADRVVADVVKRSVFLSDDTVPTVMCWYDAHQYHGDEPYIGCPFCQDRFVPRQITDEMVDAAARAAVNRAAASGVDVPVWEDRDPPDVAEFRKDFRAALEAAFEAVQ